MSTRIVSGASTHRAKQEVIRLLFSKHRKTNNVNVKVEPNLNHNGKSSTTSASQQNHHHSHHHHNHHHHPYHSHHHYPSPSLDHTVYTYMDLKRAYLKRLQTLHPDKYRAGSSCDCSEAAQQQPEQQQEAKEERQREFVELQEAWSRYEEVAKTIRRVEKGETTAASFTMFGVGCSFSDNDAERDLRAQITDQACRGWFSSGALEDGTASSSGSTLRTSLSSSSPPTAKTTAATVSLLHDDYFVTCEEKEQSSEPPRTVVNDTTMSQQQQQHPQKQHKRHPKALNHLVAELHRRRACAQRSKSNP